MRKHKVEKSSLRFQRSPPQKICGLLMFEILYPQVVCLTSGRAAVLTPVLTSNKRQCSGGAWTRSTVSTFSRTRHYPLRLREFPPLTLSTLLREVRTSNQYSIFSFQWQFSNFHYHVICITYELKTSYPLSREGGLAKLLDTRINCYERSFWRKFIFSACHLLKSGVAAIFGPQSG